MGSSLIKSCTFVSLANFVFYCRTALTCVFSGIQCPIVVEALVVGSEGSTCRPFILFCSVWESTTVSLSIAELPLRRVTLFLSVHIVGKFYAASGVTTPAGSKGRLQ